PMVNAENERRCLLVTDDRHPNDILEEGHIDFLIRRAIAGGLSPMIALRMATINAAEYFRIERAGAVAPGYQADLVVFDSLQDIRARRVYKDGKLTAVDGEVILPEQEREVGITGNSINIGSLHPQDFQIQARGRLARVRGIWRNELYTE